MKNTYQIDPVHSHVQFSVRHMMISNVRGTFTGLKGQVTYDPDDVAVSSVQAEIDVNSINTHDAQRDGHLKSADFLDAEKFPTMTFQSTKMVRDGDGLKIDGKLTIHGVTKPVTLAVQEISSEGKDPWGNTRMGASARTKLKRSDFGLNWNAALESGGFMVGDEVKLEFETELIKAQTAAA